MSFAPSPQSRRLLVDIMDVLMLLTKQPRTAAELATITGRPVGWCREVCEEAREQGLIYRKGLHQGMGRPSPLYAWQPSLLPQIAHRPDSDEIVQAPLAGGES